MALTSDSGKRRRLTLAHSPDSDDAFMFYALDKGKVDPRGLLLHHELRDIETLNLSAQEGLYEITAISFHAYPHVRHHYRLLTVGASVGDGYGPIVVSKRALTPADLDEVTVAVPGQLTTSYLVLRLLTPSARTKVMPFDRIMDAVARGDVDAGLVIHEGQLTFARQKLYRVVDLGEWWSRETGLPLPLGGTAVRRDIDDPTARKIADAMRDSIQYALDHRAEALDHAVQFARGLDRAQADRFVGMYVNPFTLELGARGEEALAMLLRLGHERGILPDRVVPEFVD